MQTLRYRSRGPEVQYLEEILTTLGYELEVSNYFGMDTRRAVWDYQSKNNLVVDGVVGLKTWTKLLSENPQALLEEQSKFLAEQDLINFAQTYGLEMATVKAVNAVESSGKGFFTDGRAKILFEGHVFWNELKKRGIQPEAFYNPKSQDVLYPKWTRAHYKGGPAEYSRLQRASQLSDQPAFVEATYCAASWGAFQIMGYHFKNLGYPSITDFVNKMQEHEREHLKAFGKFLEANNLIRYLKSKDWAKFARGYNGPLYAQNKYDIKLEQAYNRFS
ncbi:N-acetylmuramidase family protein [Echinicola sp. 20G]|uniref:N-acetylmuramidase domain-containing protein n=1 Tax=Echinicola sp. 20G TaxID=2781961 RepID=UPI00191090F6|nr:N-acetylmuramidase family protein [Echinicola sp. 20G]